MSVIVPILVICLIQTLTLGLVLPMLMLGPLVAGGQPNPRQLITAAILFIPSLFIGSGLLMWWAISWLSSAGAPGPGWTGALVIVAVVVGLLAPVNTPGPPGSMPYYLRPIFGLMFGLIAGVTMVELQNLELTPVLALAAVVVLLGIALLIARAIATPLTVRNMAKRVHKTVSNFEGQLVDVDADSWEMKQVKGTKGTLQMVFQGPLGGKTLGMVVQVKRDMEWVPQSRGNEAVVFELAQGFAGGRPTEAVLAQRRIGTPATLTFRIPNTTILSIREIAPDSLHWGQIVSLLKPVSAEEFLAKRGDHQYATSQNSSSSSAASEEGPRTIEGETTDTDPSSPPSKDRDDNGST